ncbi:uncharacterized protein LTR77_003231 [Saxophila tyrrhenica]|uniref:SEC7 domain-containing protein n=1 Tax=Saxophila tyrrhenica TaxID=1690608 RepID=A0AAV9PH86_9PEZI|nr:hypothetical protein LTR77_003231 [Saxophila tyrrhenica]
MASDYAAPTAGPSSASVANASPQKFASPPVALSKRTSSRNALSESYNGGKESPPTTPPPNARRRTKLKEKGKQTAKAQTNAEEYSAVIDNRHSHGLSWSSTTRDSVVDNLLFSLDNLSRTDVRDEEDRAIEAADFDRQKYMLPFAPPPRPTIAKTQRPRGHTYSSSSSSVYERPGMMDSPSTYSGTPKGRRSNSSSNFGIQHNMSAKVRASRHRGASSLSTDTSTIGSNGLLGRESTDNKPTFDRTSLEYGYSTITSPSNIKRNRRSLSMSQIHEMFATSEGESGASMINRGRPVPSVYSPFDVDGNAAPEPTIAAGPRKQQNPTAVGPVYVNQAPKGSSIRKVTTHTDLRSSSMPMPSQAIPQSIRNQADEFVRASSMRGQPSIPGQEKPLQSPSLQPPHGPRAAGSSRERPGFFKRVFGSSSSRGSNDRVETLGYSDLVGAPERNSSSGGGTQHPRTGTRRSSARDIPQTSGGSSHPPVALNKKPSSFFRRRKKSTSELSPPPPLPLGIANAKKTGSGADSPSASSLWKVMDPYLAGEDAPPVPSSLSKEKSKEDESSRPTTNDSTEDSDNLDIFHSGYTPPPDASLGRRNPLTRMSSDTEKGHAREDSGAAKMKVKKKKQDTLSPLQQTSFLFNSHSNENLRVTPPPISPALVSPMAREVSPVDESGEDRRPVSRASTGDGITGSQAVSPMEEEMEASQHAREGSDGDGGFVKRSIDLRPDSKRGERLLLIPTASEEMLGYSSKELATVIESGSPTKEDSSQPTSAKSPAFHTATSANFPNEVHSPTSPSTRFHSAASLPLVQIDGADPRKSVEANGMTVDTGPAEPVPALPTDVTDSNAEYRERARKIFDGDEEDVSKAEASSWLGERNTLSTKTLEAYMNLFDYAGFSILVALRLLCGKLTLKGETQQFDRIINALSARWCECNPHHGFKAQDVVHTICYSLILLNTDLHMADIGEKMSRSAYVKNTLPTIRRVAADAAPSAFEETVKPKPNASRPTLPWSDSSNTIQQLSPSERTSFEHERPRQLKRLSIRPMMDRQDSDNGTPTESAGGGNNAFNALVNQPWSGSPKGWELELENILKSFYASVRSDPLPLHGGPAMPENVPAERNLSVQNFNSGLKRTGSLISKAPSDNASFRSKAGGFRTMTMGFQNKYNRSRPKLYPNSTYGSSGTSFDDGSVWSPAQSSAWSKGSASRTLTSASMQSLGTHFSSAGGDFKHSIGFANALSQAIIREENAFTQSDGESVSMSVPGGLLEDESLALEGAPWAKEGLVQHKHHLEASGKKAKERSWNDCFAVISKGKLTLFNFNTTSNSKSIGRKAFTKPQSNGRAATANVSGQRVGGGDWMENAEQLAVFVLRQTIASVLPPPGYGKTRPNVWALSLPSGAVHLFQVGTPDIAAEFMSSANYWSARLSKEPLSGGVSNIEYGWSDNVINPALLEPSRSEAASPTPPSSSHPPGSMQNRPHHSHSNSSGAAGLSRPSFQSSLRGSFDTGFGGAHRVRLPGDKVQMAEWTPPTQSMMASQLMEVDQLRALRAYVAGVEGELKGHNELKGAIELAYSPRQANHTRAMANWQRKSDHLLREIVKFQTYVDSLAAAQKAKDAFYARKEAKEAERRAREDVVALAAAAETQGSVSGVSTGSTGTGS